MKVCAIIASGGIGKRFGSETPKQYLNLNGKPIFIWAALAFQNNDSISDIVIAAQSEYWDYIQDNAKKFGITKLRSLANAGLERQDSIYNAIQSESTMNADIILIHDAARPFINNEIIDNSIFFAQKYGCAIPASKPKETIKQVDINGFATKTIDRNSLRSIQTPQAFTIETLYKAYQAMNERDLATDDAALAERIGAKVFIFDGLEYNFKITSQFDLVIANKLLEEDSIIF